MDTCDHPFALVLPGSFHQSRNGRVFNYAQLLGPDGGAVLEHRKLTYLTRDGRDERISPGGEIKVLTTVLGDFVMPICLDFCEEKRPFADLWERLGPDWFLVPAFGAGESSIHAHQRRAATLHRQQAAAGRKRNRGFIHAGDPEPVMAESRSLLVEYSLPPQN